MKSEGRKMLDGCFAAIRSLPLLAVQEDIQHLEVGASKALNESTDLLFRLGPDGAIFVGDRGAFFRRRPDTSLADDVALYLSFAARTTLVFDRESGRPFASFLEGRIAFVPEDMAHIDEKSVVHKIFAFSISDAEWSAFPQGLAERWALQKLTDPLPTFHITLVEKGPRVVFRVQSHQATF